MNTRIRDLFGIAKDRVNEAGVYYVRQALSVRYIIRNEIKEPKLPKLQLRGVGYTRKNRSQSKKARKTSKLSRRRNR